MSDETLKIIEAAVYLAALVGGAILLPIARRWLIAKEGEDKANVLWGWAETFVKAAEQMLGAGTGSQKYIWVLEALRGISNSHNIKADDKTLEAAIEAAVLELKQGQPAAAAVGNVVVAAPVEVQQKEV